MRKVIYQIGNYETESYAEAKTLQPHGQLNMRLEDIIEYKEYKFKGGAIKYQVRS